MKPARCNFLLSYSVIFFIFLAGPFLAYKYVILGPSEMHDFFVTQTHLSSTLGEHPVHKFIRRKKT